MACCLSMGTIVCYRGYNFNSPSSSVPLLTGLRTGTSLSLNVKPRPPISSGMLLSSALTPPSSLTFYSGSSSFSVPLFTGRADPNTTVPDFDRIVSGWALCGFVKKSDMLDCDQLVKGIKGLSLALDLISSVGMYGKTSGKRRGFVVRATKYSLCQTKRNRSRKSLARTHGFRKRMSTTRGRAVIKRRRAKGRSILCTKSNPCSGKHV
ncbi:hypothetical protein OROGR_003079 [Orobanche gracilis]